jgi:subtilase family serine protease
VVQAFALPNLTVLSISYDASEVQAQGAATSPPEEYVQFQHGVQMVAAMGITVVVASGDQGSMGPPLTACPSWYPSYGLPGQASVNWLGASPGSTAVGGTMWPGYTRPASESVWSQPAGFGPTPFACGAAGGGGGQSVVSARPPWQAAAGAGIAGTKRLMPDLSMLAGAPGFATIMNGASSITQGTSAGAPILGAAVMRINAERLAAGRKPVGFLNPLLYGPLAPTFRDITQGNNDVFGNGICCTAGPGFDMASGLGSPDIGQWPALIP